MPRKNWTDSPCCAIAVRSVTAGVAVAVSACVIAASVSSPLAKLGSLPAAYVTEASACSCFRLVFSTGRKAASRAVLLAGRGSVEAM